MSAACNTRDLLRDCLAHLRATSALYLCLPPSKRAAHLAKRSDELAERIERTLSQGSEG